MYRFLRPLLFKLGPADAHALAWDLLWLLEKDERLRELVSATAHPSLRVRAMGLEFPGPVGLAGGLDKNGERSRALAALGFGHIEVGTVTALSQGPNPPPNLFRLPEDRALINRLGFPNIGAAQVGARLRKGMLPCPLGISIGKSRAVSLEPLSDVVDDYVKSLRAVKHAADFMVVNISSPNTQGLRSLQTADVARALLGRLREESDEVPLLVKLAPDLDDAAIDELCEVLKSAGCDGAVATNTTISREGLRTPPDLVAAMGAGGLSGPPLHERALSVVSRVRAALGKELCVIGVGGISNADQALAMLAAGADLLQLYTALIYEGPTLPRVIHNELSTRWKRQERQEGS
ncbi:MAG: quinone-dependent dihydroorotate dehydrogenase [Polyangiaceae bacterium]